MTEKYNPQEIERKWQQRWEADGLYRTVEDPNRPKFYFLTMLPYPSGDLHIGHWYAMTPSDAAARYRRMRGYNVFFPIGFDAFGLPAENAAIKHGIHPYRWTMANIERMRRQLRSMGAMWAWDREAVTCDPEYYKWTQWFFLKLYDHGLAYRKFQAVDFCPSCNTTLAREQVWGEDKRCERCDTPVIKKELEQWFFKITNYAEELLRFDGIDWPERVRLMQTNWVGRSEGAEVVFTVAPECLPDAAPGEERLVVFTTRPDTLWGATFMVLAPEHPLVARITTEEQRSQVEAYVEQARRLDEITRTAADKEKTGVFTGAYAVNPVNGRRIPIWIGDYVMMTYGTGAIMGVPSHDERDFAFALKYGLPIVPVIERPDGRAKSLVWEGSVRAGFAQALAEADIPFEYVAIPDRGRFFGVTLTDGAAIDAYARLLQSYLHPGHWADIVGMRWHVVFDDGIMTLDSAEADQAIMARCHAGYDYMRRFQTTMQMWHAAEWYRDVLFHDQFGTMINSGPFTGTPGDRAKAAVIAWLEEQGIGKAAVAYRLRDWLISRQRYWGAPIPIVYCPSCGTVPVPYGDLPVLLPEDAEFLPTGESPLKFHEGFRYVKCPRCGGDAERETDTMDTFMCSSWYQYAYISPYHKAGQRLSPDDLPWDKEKGDYWLPVDQYTGGIEHANMHLIYTRFFTKAMRDMGLVPFDEPMLRLFNQGIILGEDNEKMSKSRGNVVAPDDLVERYGADTVRAYLMFIGPWEMGGPWNSRGIEGVYRFMQDVWSLVVDEADGRPAQPPAEKEVRDLRRLAHQTIRDVTNDIETFSFNTAVAKLMALRNALKAGRSALAGTPAWDEAVDNLLLLLAPIAPHIAEELWQRRHPGPSVHLQAWPTWDPEVAKEETVTLVVQVNGKVRGKVEAPAGVDEATARQLALAEPNVQRHIEGKTIRKVIFAEGKLVNIVVG
ncbi:MAG: leucine--tRNA ligase [Caldilineales bacterium]|nr:leucine--tRNA ligase [Caldilineales bacterium]MDW8316814.1 leucine--tRNA ligase [Anaerolineae bacterium]